jgi:hypothetical protein
MDKTAREFIIIAYNALQKAYEYESDGLTNINKESANKVGDALQMVGDLSRSE